MKLLHLLLLPFIASATIQPATTTSYSSNIAVLEPYMAYESPTIPIRGDVLVSSYKPTPESDKQLLERYFGPVWQTMYDISKCESEHHQFKADGSLLMSPTHDYGYLQINEKTWDVRAKELGLDYKHSLEDNIKMAKIVYDAQKFSGWTCSVILGITG